MFVLGDVRKEWPQLSQVAGFQAGRDTWLDSTCSGRDGAEEGEFYILGKDRGVGEGANKLTEKGKLVRR